MQEQQKNCSRRNVRIKLGPAAPLRIKLGPAAPLCIKLGPAALLRMKLGPAAPLRIRIDSFIFTTLRKVESQKRCLKGVGGHKPLCREN